MCKSQHEYTKVKPVHSLFISLSEVLKVTDTVIEQNNLTSIRSSLSVQFHLRVPPGLIERVKSLCYETHR